jgi:Signal transduction histidine kinase
MSRGGNEQQHNDRRGEKERSPFHAGKGNYPDVVVALEQGEERDALLVAEKQARACTLELQHVQAVLNNVEALVALLVAREQRTDDLSSPVLAPLRYELAALSRGARFLVFVRSVLRCQYIVLSELVLDGTQLVPIWSSDAVPAAPDVDLGPVPSSDGRRQAIHLDTVCEDRELLKRFKAGEPLSIDVSLSLFPLPVGCQMMLPLLYQGELIGALVLAYNDYDSPPACIAAVAGTVTALDTVLLNVITHLATLLLLEERDQRDKDRYAQAWHVANDEIEHLQALKGTFLSMLSREFRSSLLSIQRASETIREQVESSDLGKEFALDIYTDARRLVHLIDHMTDLVRMEDKTIRSHATWLNMNTLITDVLHQWRLVIARCHIQVQVRLATALPLLRGERRSLLHVINTFVDRAISYTPQGSDLIVSSHVEERLVYVSVYCHAAHIPLSRLEHIFAPDVHNVRADNSSQLSVNSTTLSHSVSLYEIAVRHGGRLWTESTPARGFAFHFAVRYA